MGVIPPELVGAGLGGLSKVTDALMIEGNNKRSRKWNEKMYNLQRQHSLQDFAMQNEYNSPEAQMNRLRKAGLNPNLVYGKGADNTASPIRSSQVESWKPQAPQLDLSGQGLNMVMGYADMQMKKAQTDNLKAQNSVLLQDALLRSAQVANTTASTEKTREEIPKVKAETAKTSQDTESSKFDLDMKSELRQTSIDAVRAQLQKTVAETDKTKADTQYTLNQDERAKAQSAQSIQEGIERILTMRAEREMNPYKKAKLFEEVKSVQRDNRIKELDIKLKDAGLQPGDALWQRMLKNEVDRIQGDIDNFKKSIRSSAPGGRPKSSASGSYRPLQ